MGLSRVLIVHLNSEGPSALTTWQSDFGKARTRIEEFQEINPNSFICLAVREILPALCWACSEDPKVGCLCDKACLGEWLLPCWL